MAKIIIVDPRGCQGAVNGYRPSPNIGIAYLIPMLRRHDHEVLVIDLNNDVMTDDQVLAFIDEWHPDIVAFSVKTATMKDARNLARKMKNNLPRLPVILGGPHTTLAWDELVTDPWFDVIFAGEGEQVFPIIAHRLMAKEPVEELPGVITKKNLKDCFRLDRPLIAAPDLDMLPFPEYDQFPENVRKSLRTAYPFVTSRGCVYKCVYCSVPEISGRGFRKRKPQSLIEELKWAQKKYGITHFEIIDDVFNLDIRRCKEICSALIDAGLGMAWSCPNGLRADRVDKELAILMFNSGCHSVMVGIESVDPSILATIKKGEKIEDIERGIRIFKEAGINVGGYFIIGLPGDSFKTQTRSVEFAKRMGIGAHFNMLVPYPGTELWKWTKTNARFLCNPEEGLHFAGSSDKVKSVIETDDFSASKRRQAYEMVHTRLGRFDMLILSNVSRWEYYRKMVRLLWNYDRHRLVPYGFQKLVGKLHRFFGKLVQPLRERFSRRKAAAERLRDPIDVYNLVRVHLPTRGSVALDIGSNVGQYISLIAPRFHRVLAFEPSRVAFSELTKKQKDFPNLEVYNVALLDTTEIIYLYKYEKAWKDGDLSVLNDGQGFECWGNKIGKVPVLAIRLDDLRLSSVNFIKLDVEGAERAVIQGSLETIKKNRPTLFIEIHEKFQGDHIISILQDMYKFKVIRHPAYAPATFLWERHYFLFAIPQDRHDRLCPGSDA